MTWYSWEGNDLILRLRIQPNTSRDAFIAPYAEDFYKVAVSSPPVDGKANKKLIKFLSKKFGLPHSRISIESGKSSRSKSLRLKSPTQLPIPCGELPDRAGKDMLEQKIPGQP
ncbi:MAG: DUF167 family protein [Gammaproteobacteria bacterium]|nr:DUF167 family protein [Gammaproteobacteria bacterium]